MVDKWDQLRIWLEDEAANYQSSFDDLSPQEVLCKMDEIDAQS